MTSTLTPQRGRRRPEGDEPTTEDPRIARRRQQVEAERGRRRRGILIAVAVVAGLLAAVVAVLRSPVLDVDRVVVAGSNSIDDDDVVRASGIGRGDAMVDVDLAAARDAVMALPDVASARVEREWPGTVRISVTDERPIAVVGTDERRVLVGRGGRVLGEAPALDDPSVAGLPLVTPADSALVDAVEPGAEAPAAVVATVVVLEQMIDPLRGALGGIDLAEDGSLTLLLRDDPAVEGTGGRIELGVPEEVPAKLLAAASMLAGARMDCLDVLDVREPSRPTISRVPDCDAGEPTVGATTVPTTTAPKKKPATTSTTTPGSGVPG